MKLYNLYETVILEELEKHHKIISEGVSKDDVLTAINGDENGKHYHVKMDYRDKDGRITNRWIQVYQFVDTIANNAAISAYEVSSNTGKPAGWRIYRLDRIENFKISRVPFYKAISDIKPSVPKYNKNGNRTPTIKKLNAKAEFNYQYKPSTIKQQQYKDKQKVQPQQQTTAI